MFMSRRAFLVASGVVPATPLLGQSSGAEVSGVSDVFPSQAPAVVREMVAVSHGNVVRVRELLSGRPALANAAWDWGFGDWETALGAASHVGNREIADLLLRAGARPSLFSAAMLGQLEVVRALVAASPGVQKVRGPHGITLLAHAKSGGALEVVKYLESVGGADERYVNEPMDDRERTAVTGVYTFGRGTTDRLVVSVNERTGLVIKREGGVERNLFHHGARVFHPSGAEAVRIRFAEGEPAATVVIEDGGLVVTGRRR
ncbi:MAG TPA: ankyrin repeat domain-containing protein [Vicinamibacterales bacterium]|nr:ankyrin repeat domain-containing protein [Vicinamibacterales bacterium]